MQVIMFWVSPSKYAVIVNEKRFPHFFFLPSMHNHVVYILNSNLNIEFKGTRNEERDNHFCLVLVGGWFGPWIIRFGRVQVDS